MLNRMNRAGKVPYKIVLALPLIALLALALAQPRLVIARGAAADEKKEVVQKEDKTAMSEQELKNLQLKLEEKAKFLEEKINAASDPAEKEKLKQALEDLYKKRQVVLAEHGLTGKLPSEEKLKELQVKLSEKEKFLKELYASADTAEKKEKIRQDLETFYKKRQAILEEYGIAKMKTQPSREQMEKKLASVKEMRLKLTQLIAEEKNEEKLKEHKLKLAEVGRFEEELKIRIEEMSKK